MINYVHNNNNFINSSELPPQCQCTQRQTLKQVFVVVGAPSCASLEDDHAKEPGLKQNRYMRRAAETWTH